tara:strand:- start:2105 stop:2299 length:195 start_codon:yes stop_codon:yes gene_type:complete
MIAVRVNNATMALRYMASLRKSENFFFEFQILEINHLIPAPGYLKMKTIINSIIISIINSILLS